MRRRPGLQGLQRGVEARVSLRDLILVLKAPSEIVPNSRAPVNLQEHFKSLGESVQQTKVELMKAQMASFKEKLEEFAINHRSRLYHVFIQLLRVLQAGNWSYALNN